MKNRWATEPPRPAELGWPKLVCGWCAKVIRLGDEPTSTGICSHCRRLVDQERQYLPNRGGVR